jgi:hypothetical protein
VFTHRCCVFKMSVLLGFFRYEKGKFVPAPYLLLHNKDVYCGGYAASWPGRFTLRQRFPNFFQVGTTFISQNVLRNTLLLSPLKANCLRFSTPVCDTQFTLILFFLSFLD